MNAEYHIASFIVLTRPDTFAATCAFLATLPGTELHQHDAIGKIVITVEAESTAHISRITDAIHQQNGVLACNMVFHQFEPASEVAP